MYQFADHSGAVDKTRLWVQTCTSMAPTPDNLRRVREATAFVRTAVSSGDVIPLRRMLSRADVRRAGAADVLAAAGEAVIDEMGELPRVGLHDLVRRIAQIERDVFAAIDRTTKPVRAA
jgi:hypothetical protein